MTSWIDRARALELLGVRPQTLYAYVSRGRIGMKPDPADPRRSLYRADDVAAIGTRRARGRSASNIAASTIAWGEPTIVTAISTVEHGRLIYRGEEAAELAREASLEETAALLWQSPSAPEFLSGPQDKGAALPNAFHALAELAASGQPSLGRSPAALAGDARIAIGRLAQAFGAEPGDGPLHLRLARGWGLDISAADVMRCALVLIADHDLNASTFATRVAASTGAPLAACLLAGLATLTGPLHGGAPAAFAALATTASQAGPEAAVSQRLSFGRSLPAFGHPLYPDGDARAKVLLALVNAPPVLAGLRDTITAMTGAEPNIDFALAVIAARFGMPADAPFRLFALGRSVGWAAHAIEQCTTGTLIRPRGRYQGALPVDEPA